MDDPASLEKGMAGAYGVFSVQNFWLPGVGAEGEVRQGRAAADAARAAGIEHFLYSSVGGAERKTGIPHFESKWQIEQHIRALGLPATILRPVAFMDNFNWSRPQILGGVYSGFGLRPEKRQQLIAVEDIGAIAAIAFAQPARFIGQALEIAGNELSDAEIAVTFSRVIGRPVTLVPPATPDDSEPEEELLKMLNWFNEHGYEADITAVRALHPGLLTLEAWLRQTGWQNDTAS